MTIYSLPVIEKIKELMDDAVSDYYNSLCWYEYKILPMQEKYKTLIDGDLYKQTWFFVLTLVS